MMCSHVSAKSHGRVSKALLTVVKTRTVYRKTRMVSTQLREAGLSVK
jgi:hypothetical protein